ncbi:hypothetical protein ACIQM3_27825 [Streptomyces sp. NPDC091271]|uniref:hypothetical protein n=1 Tax=Streptomyces sp. NPDC091271 TaxID=3365980 RepID=UPI00381BACD0
MPGLGDGDPHGYVRLREAAGLGPQEGPDAARLIATDVMSPSMRCLDADETKVIAAILD